ncbi:MAG: MFS transporter [Sciscionella sp.]
MNTPQSRSAATKDIQQDVAGTSPTNVRWKIFLLLLVIVTINYVDRGSISVALPLITKDLSMSPAVTGIVLSAFFWSYALMQIPGGWLVDKFGPRRMVAASCTGWGIAQALTAAVSGVGSFISFRVLLGLAEAPVYPSGGKINATWMPAQERGRGAVILDGGAPLGAAVGGIAIAGLILLTGSWRWSFLIAGIVTILIGIYAYRYIRNSPREHPKTNEAEVEYVERAHAAEDATAPDSVAKPNLLRYLKFRSFWSMCLGWLGFNGVFYGLLTWGPLYLAQTKGFDIKTIGFSTLIIFGAGFVGELVGGFLADWWRGRGANPNLVLRTLLGVAGLLVVGGLIGVTLVSNPVAAVALLSLVLFFLRWVGLYWSVPSILGGRDNAGVLGGAMNFSGNISGFVTPAAVGFIVAATGGYYWALLYFVGAGALMTISVVTLNYNRRLPV